VIIRFKDVRLEIGGDHFELNAPMSRGYREELVMAFIFYSIDRTNQSAVQIIANGCAVARHDIASIASNVFHAPMLNFKARRNMSGVPPNHEHLDIYRVKLITPTKVF
jgi:hypothetical protein